MEENLSQLWGFAQHAMVPVEVWNKRIDLEYVLVIGHGHKRPEELQPADHWQQFMVISDQIVVFGRMAQP